MDLKIEDLRSPDIVFQIGAAPRRIDILTSITGVTFEAAWPRRKSIDLEGLKVSVIGRDDLLMNKRATGRSQDMVDVQRLEEYPAE